MHDFLKYEWLQFTTNWTIANTISFVNLVLIWICLPINIWWAKHFSDIWQKRYRMAYWVLLGWIFVWFLIRLYGLITHKHWAK